MVLSPVTPASMAMRICAVRTADPVVPIALEAMPLGRSPMAIFSVTLVSPGTVPARLTPTCLPWLAAKALAEMMSSALASSSRCDPEPIIRSPTEPRLMRFCSLTLICVVPSPLESEVTALLTVGVRPCVAASVSSRRG